MLRTQTNEERNKDISLSFINSDSKIFDIRIIRKDLRIGIFFSIKLREGKDVVNGHNGH